MRVLLSGYYGFGNAGDEALLGGLLAGLQNRGIEPLVASGDPAATRAMHGVEAVDRVRGIPLALLRSGAVISGGGGLLQDTTSRRSLRYYLSVVAMARRLGKRVIVYGQSVGPLSSAGKEAVFRSLRGLPVAVRDRPSAELLHEGGIETHLVADPALLLPPGDLRSGDSPDDRGSNAPVLFIPRKGHPGLTRALADAALKLQSGGSRVAALLLHPSEDRGEGEALAGAVSGIDVKEAADPRIAMREIAGASAVASARLHGLILAAAAGVPFAGLVYDPKVAGFLEQAQAPAFRRPEDGPALAEALLSADRAAYEARGKELKIRAEAGLDWLVSELQR